MKICILSMQKINNAGSLLQSYSLKKILEGMGHSVSFIDIEPNAVDNALCSGAVARLSDDCKSSASKRVISKLSKIDRYAINRIIIKKKHKRQNILFDNFRKEVLCISDSDNKDNYDVCVIGSDEVFNCASGDKPWGFTSQLFGNVEVSDKVITYAASCGAVSLEDLNEAVKKHISETFKKVSAFSVRDENTANFVKELSDKEVVMSLDPVVVGDFSREIDNVGECLKLPDRFCIVYSYYNRVCTKKEIKEILSFCKRHKLTPVSVGAPQMWIKNHLILTPFEMLSVFKKAKFVFTDTFHGTIFAAKYSERFATMVRKSNKNKLTDLISKLKAENHRLYDISEIEEKFNIINDFSVRNEIISDGRIMTEKYLRESI